MCAPVLTTSLRRRLNNGNLAGTLPESFGQLSSLVVLSLMENSLTGTLPASFSSMTSLTYACVSAAELPTCTLQPLTPLQRCGK